MKKITVMVSTRDGTNLVDKGQAFIDIINKVKIQSKDTIPFSFLDKKGMVSVFTEAIRCVDAIFNKENPYTSEEYADSTFCFAHTKILGSKLDLDDPSYWLLGSRADFNHDLSMLVHVEPMDFISHGREELLGGYYVKVDEHTLKRWTHYQQFLADFGKGEHLEDLFDSPWYEFAVELKDIVEMKLKKEWDLDIATYIRKVFDEPIAVFYYED